MGELHYAPAHVLAEKIRTKQIGALELLDHFLARVERHNPALNAIIWMDLDGARKRARAADEATAKGENWGPLHGLPMTIKESFDFVGSPTTWGIPAMKDNIADSNAIAIQRLIDAGAVIFGKTNVPIYLADWQSYNEIYGTTNNPWDVTRIPGGSSGGSAAALASGLSALEMGSDIGASIRNPAHYCGVFGHKPTFDIVTPKGQALPGVHKGADISVVGPLARSAEDLELALDLIAGPDEIDGTVWQVHLPPPRKTALKDFKVAVMLNDANADVEQDYQDCLQNVADALAKAGATVSDTARPELETSRVMEVYIWLLRAATSRRYQGEELEWLRDIAANGDEENWYLKMMAEATVMEHREWLTLSNERAGMRLAWAEFFKEWDILLCPAAASAAFPHDHEGERHNRNIIVNNREVPVTDQLFWAGYSGVVLLPSTVAPAGRTPDGLPLGLQAIAAHGEDLTSIEFCKRTSQEIAGFEPPPGYD